MKKKICLMVLIIFLTMLLFSCSDGIDDNKPGPSGVSPALGKGISNIANISEYFVDGFTPYVPYNDKLTIFIKDEDALKNKYIYEANVHSVERMYHNPSKIKKHIEGYTISINYSKYLSNPSRDWRANDICDEIKGIYGDMEICETEFLVDYIAYSSRIREKWSYLDDYNLEFWEAPPYRSYLESTNKQGHSAVSRQIRIILDDIVETRGIQARAYLYFDYGSSTFDGQFRIRSLSTFSENGITYIIDFLLLWAEKQTDFPLDPEEYAYLNDIHISLQEKLLTELIKNNTL